MEKVLNFKELPIKDIEGKNQNTDVRKLIGNALFNLADDVAEHDLGIKIYHSDGAIEINEQEKVILKKYAGQFKYILRVALEDALTNV